MEDNKICKVTGCSWPVVLCPELCAPHWWKLDKAKRDKISRAEIKGFKFGNHPSAVYQGLIEIAIRSLNISQGILAKYVHEDGDVDARHSTLTECATCKGQRVHHTVFRDPDTLMVCDECQTMIPSVLPGSQRMPGMEAKP